MCDIYHKDVKLYPLLGKKTLYLGYVFGQDTGIFIKYHFNTCADTSIHNEEFLKFNCYQQKIHARKIKFNNRKPRGNVGYVKNNFNKCEIVGKLWKLTTVKIKKNGKQQSGQQRSKIDCRSSKKKIDLFNPMNTNRSAITSIV